MKQETCCPVCKKPADTKFTPFCSDRCSKIDLGRWFSESYTVATDEEPELEDERE